MGLLEPRQGIGTVVCSPAAAPANPLATALLEKRKLVADLLDVRKMIEPPLARRAALHASREEIADMEDILAAPGGEGAPGRTRNRRRLRVSLQHRRWRPTTARS